jgi:hypothetical protein
VHSTPEACFLSADLSITLQKNGKGGRILSAFFFKIQLKIVPELAVNRNR